MKPSAQRLVMNLLLSIALFTLAFHFLVLLQVIPYGIVWGGKLERVEDMYAFEAVSIAVNLFFFGLLLLKSNLIRHRLSRKWIDGILWAFAALFALNTLGNLAAESLVEMLVFGPLTLALAVLLFLLLRKRDS